MSLSELISISVGSTVNTPEVRKKRDADAKLAVGITLIVLGVLAAAAAVVLSFCFGMVLVPIIVGGVSLALGITGIVLAILSKENKKTDAPISNDSVSNNPLPSTPPRVSARVDSAGNELAGDGSDSNGDPLPPPPRVSARVDSAGNELAGDGSDSNGDPLPPPPRVSARVDSAGNELAGDGSDSNGDPLPPPPRVSARVDSAGNELAGDGSDSNGDPLPPPPRVSARVDSAGNELAGDGSDSDNPPALPPRRRERGSPSQLFGSDSKAIKVSDDDQDQRSQYRRSIRRTIEKLKQQKSAQSGRNHMNPSKPETVTDVINRMSYNSRDESSDEYSSSDSEDEWEDLNLLHDRTKKRIFHEVASAVVQGAQGALQSVRGWNPFASRPK